MTADLVHCVIPARGGSKGIPRKNLRFVDGLPLVARAVRAAQASRLVNSAVVSTDDDEIAEIARNHGADVIIRPDSLSTDESSSESALLHYLEVRNITRGKLLLVQPTSPFLEGNDLDQLVERLGSFDSALTVTESHSFIWRQDSTGSLSGVNHNSSVRTRRQDLTHHEYAENGAAYGMDVIGFHRARHRFFGRIGFVVMPKIRSLEIDSIDDLQLAESIGQTLRSLKE